VLGLSPLRLLIVAVVALIVLGPDKLPQVAKQAGSLWHSLRSLQQRVETELREVAPDLPRSADLVRFARSPVALLNELADKAKAEQEGDGDAEASPEDLAATEYTPPGYDAPVVIDPDRPPLVWGDPSLN
jgi:sec-independent protein translocase protein TatB